MTMKKPVAAFGRGKFEGIGFHWHDIDHLFHGRKFALAIDEPEEMSVEVHGVAHHRSIVKDDPDIFAFLYQDPVPPLKQSYC